MSLEIGLRLKEARESMGLTIQDIRDQTRIESGYLIALENGDFDKLPSPYFVRTCIRSYAKCVGIEPHHLLKKYHPIPGDSGPKNTSKKRNTGRQKAIQDRSRTTSTFPRFSPREESGNASDEERGRQGAHSSLERTKRIDSLPQRTNPNLRSGGVSTGDTDFSGTSSRRERLSEMDRSAGDSGPASIKKRNTDRQRAIQDSSRVTSKFSRFSSRGESDRSGEEQGRAGAHTSPERAIRIDSLSQRTTPNLGAGFSSGDTDPPDGEQELRYPPQELSTRSRRSERAREGSSSRKIHRIVIVAGVVLFIPLATWGALSLWKKEPSAETPSSTVQQQSETGGVNAETMSSSENDSPEKGKDKAEVTLADKSDGVAHYQTVATGELLVEIGPVADVCWVQVREKREGGNYLEDVTLRNKDTYQYKHPADGSSNLYIEFGAPHAVEKIKVNGQPIDSSKIIHIERTD